jgi:hypothetical protein
MTSAPAIQTNAAAVAAVEDPRRALRLRVKPKAAAKGFVDGGRWPRSRTVLGARQRLTLLVVPPETSSQAAHEALRPARSFLHHSSRKRS